MAAEQPGAFLLEVANIGTELNAAFTKFISYRVVHDRRLENLYATLDITTGALRRLGTSLNSHALDFQMQDDVTRQLAEKAKANFVALLTMAKEATAEGGAWKSEGTINGQNIVTEVDPWLLITMAVGGNEKAKDFWSGLDDTRDDLVEMEHVVKYMILKTMEEKLVHYNSSNTILILPQIHPHCRPRTRAQQAQVSPPSHYSTPRIGRKSKES